MTDTSYKKQLFERYKDSVSKLEKAVAAKKKDKELISKCHKNYSEASEEFKKFYEDNSLFTNQKNNPDYDDYFITLSECVPKLQKIYAIYMLYKAIGKNIFIF
ncbi:Uncharacterised protein [uncultured archaeon]|nr:Uncharacterised protein [uncultured archaeon]